MGKRSLPVSALVEDGTGKQSLPMAPNGTLPLPAPKGLGGAAAENRELQRADAGTPTPTTTTTADGSGRCMKWGGRRSEA